ncbi:hypothetical protein, partial [Escherichia coli]|uniref:hypothetical protein n=1 Tax=Escherichia coli TaxID=562 RepID=UPI00215B122C
AVKKAKTVPVASAPVTTATPKVTKQSPAKKKLEATPAKVFKRKRKTRNTSPNSVETMFEEKRKKTH